MSYHDAYHRFVRKICNHVGVGPYEPISEEQMQQWVDEFKAEIDAWHEDWKQIKREVKG